MDSRSPVRLCCSSPESGLRACLRTPKLGKGSCGTGEPGHRQCWGHVARGGLGAVIQELGWQGLWYLAPWPPVRLYAVGGIPFSSKLQSS